MMPIVFVQYNMEATPVLEASFHAGINGNTVANTTSYDQRSFFPTQAWSS
jgi:hypothetical protein